MRSLLCLVLGLVLLLAACGSPLSPGVAASPARVIAAAEQGELTMEIQELI